MTTGQRIALSAIGVAAAGTAALVAFSAREARRISRRAPADGKFLDAGGARIHYRDEGSGPAIVIVHGLAGQMRNFSYALLERLTPHFRVILVDRPGSGYSTLPPGPHPGVRAQAEIIAEFIRLMALKAGIGRPLLVGHSLGGALSLALAAEHPELISGLALIAPLTQPVNEVPEPFKALAIQPPLLRSIVAWTLILPLAPFAGDAGLVALFTPHKAPRDFGYACGGALPLRPANFIAAACDLHAASEEMPQIAAAYSRLQVPIEVLFGRGDAVLSPTLHGEGLAQSIPHARLEIIEGGHMIPVSAPDETARWIVEAWRRIAAPVSKSKSAV